MDTSRVALALARARLMGARYPYYLLRDTPEGQRKEAEVTGKAPPDDGVERVTRGDVRDGFVYERAPHVTLGAIAKNDQINVIWEDYQTRLEPLRHALNEALHRRGERAAPDDAGEDGPWEEWEIPRHPEDPWGAMEKEHADATDPSKPKKTREAALAKMKKHWGAAFEYDTLEDLPPRPADPWDPDEWAEAIRLHGEWWSERIARQKAIDASIAQKADVELLYDRPYEDKTKVRVAGPFTVESLSPHRMVSPDEDVGEISGWLAEEDTRSGESDHRVTAQSHTEHPAPRSNGSGADDFATIMLTQLRAAGVQQAAKQDKIDFDALDPWPGDRVAAIGTYTAGGEQKRAAIMIGPEFGTVARPDIVAAANEALDAKCDTLIVCGFAFDAHTSALTKLGPLPILKARMNPDLHMSADLAATGAGNLFVVFGEPDVTHEVKDGRIEVTVHGVDVFDPKSGEVRASGPGEIAAWFIDTDYDQEAFHVRHAYFTGANDPYKALKTTLRAEVDPEAWATLNRLTSRPFAKPSTGMFAVKVINHLGDEVMKVFGVGE